MTGDKNSIDRTVYLETSLPIQVVVPKLQERRLVKAMAFIEEVLRSDGEADVKAKLWADEVVWMYQVHVVAMLERALLSHMMQ